MIESRSVEGSRGGRRVAMVVVVDVDETCSLTIERVNLSESELNPSGIRPADLERVT